MHPLKDDPMYAPCLDIIRIYDSCNNVQFKRFTNQCHELYEKMSQCMRQQRLTRRDANLIKSRQKRVEREKLNEELVLEW